MFISRGLSPFGSAGTLVFGDRLSCPGSRGTPLAKASNETGVGKTA